jgi:hypothetical protein
MSQRATRFVTPGVEPAFPPSPFGGSLIADLERTVETAEDGNRKLRILPEPQPPTKPDQRDYIKFVAIGEIEMRCSNVDCFRPACLIGESRDGEVLPYCTRCAVVEFAQWMAGV